MRNPYEILGVQKNAGEAEIKKAFRKLAKIHHPDRNRNDPKAQDKFSEVNSAYEILGEPAKRAQFDRGEIDADGKPRGFAGGGGSRAEGSEGFPFGFGTGAGGFSSRRGGPAADEFFSQVFSEGLRSAGAGGRRRAPQKGGDVTATLTLTLEQIAADEKMRLELSTGRDVDVMIPKGASDGQVIRLRGLGENPPGAEPGDALLTIRIAPHERFTVDGANLRVRLPVELADAVLGVRLRVPTLTGHVEMTVPPMTSSGRTFRLRGKGLPGKTVAGDLLVTTEIALPESADEALLDYARKHRPAKVEPV